MTLVERFIEFNGWPTGRKTVLLAGVALGAFALFVPFIFWAGASSGIANVRQLEICFGAGMLVLLVCLFAGLIEVKAGREGRWTAYLISVVFGVWIQSLTTLFGFWSTPMTGWTPVVVILVTLWYDERIGWFAFVFSVVDYALFVGFALTGVLPYAPMMLDRTLDAQRSGVWAAAVFLPFAGYYFYGFLLSILVVAARGVQDRRLQEANRGLQRCSALISRYVPSQIAEKIIRGEYSETVKPERAKLTVVFSDIEGFTEASDHLDPEDLADLLNEYLVEMMTIAERHAATISQIIGDGIMAFFGAPQATSDQDHALRAVRMSLEMQRRMVELEDIWVRRGVTKPFRIRIGVNTGHASVGDYGSPGRKLYSAIGLQPNLAARIQAHCAPGRVLLSHSTWALVKDEIPCQSKGEIQFKGMRYAVNVFEVAAA